MAGEQRFNNVAAPTASTTGKSLLYSNTDKYLHSANEAGYDHIQLAAFFTSNQSGDFTLANSASAQSPFAAANDVITLPASTTYLFELFVVITGMGATTRTTALEFDAGTASLTSIMYEGVIATGAANSIYGVAPNGITAIAATAQVLNATVATAAATIRARGIVRINAAGTFIPQIKFSADPTGTILSKKESFFLMTPLGSNTVASIGSWA
jgi:hypothetical protein